jgi:hypothetical protein
MRRNLHVSSQSCQSANNKRIAGRPQAHRDATADYGVLLLRTGKFLDLMQQARRLRPSQVVEHQGIRSLPWLQSNISTMTLSLPSDTGASSSASAFDDDFALQRRHLWPIRGTG